MTDRIKVTTDGRVSYQGHSWRSALGKGGISEIKQEGDGKTPVGIFPLRMVYYRADKVPALKTGLPIQPIDKDDGWCDEPKDKNYNKLVKLPYPASHEKLWRDDNLYDAVIIIGYNDNPVIPGKGSAIFMHVAKEGYASTEGCVALEKNDLLELLNLIDEKTFIEIGG